MFNALWLAVVNTYGQMCLCTGFTVPEQGRKLAHRKLCMHNELFCTSGRANVVNNKAKEGFYSPQKIIKRKLKRKLFEVDYYRSQRESLTDYMSKRRHSNSLWARGWVPGRGSQSSPHVCWLAFSSCKCNSQLHCFVLLLWHGLHRCALKLCPAALKPRTMESGGCVSKITRLQGI